MRKKPELLVTAGSVEEVSNYIDAGADAVHIGDNRFGLRMPGHFHASEIAKAIQMAHRKGAKAYVAMNNILHNEMLEELPDYLHDLYEHKADALVFGDPAVLAIIRKSKLPFKLHWSTDMTATNYATANYWADRGASRVVLARELNLQEIHEVYNNTQMEVQVQVHGMTNIYHSKRFLVQSYMEHQGNAMKLQDTGPDQGLFLIEHERRELKYPIFEDENGTHIMSAEDICLLEVMDELLEVDLDSLKIEGLLKSTGYNIAVIRAYREAIDAFYRDPDHYEFNPEWLERINRLQNPDRELNFGFLFKEQVY